MSSSARSSSQPIPSWERSTFPGLQASFTQFFGTKDQPNKPARSAFQVAGLVAPGYLLEIEVIAVKGK